MTVRVNFLPKAYRVRCRRAGRIRHWLVFCGALILAEVLSARFLCLLARQVSEDRHHLAIVEREKQELSVAGAGLAARQRDLSRRASLVDRLARKHRWSQVLTAMAGRLPDTVMLTGLQTEPPKGQVVVPPPSAGRPNEAIPKPDTKTQPDKESIATGFLLTGIATDHESVAELMRGLNQESRLGPCQLQATNRQPFLNGEGVTFSIRLRWE
jgi:Tfp pilus assembly protein PilN